METPKPGVNQFVQVEDDAIKAGADAIEVHSKAIIGRNPGDPQPEIDTAKESDK